MKLKLIVQSVVIILITILSVSSAYALRELGNNPFYHSHIKSEAELRSMLLENKDDVRDGLSKAGYPQLYEPLYQQLPEAEISKVQYSKGQTFDWMFYRKNGKGKVRIDKDVVWESTEPMKSYEFYVDHDGQRYIMTVPPVCGNLTLAGIIAAPVAKAPVVPPVVPPADAAGKQDTGSPGTGPGEQLKAADSKRLPILFDAGYLYQFDPAHYLLLRVGTEYAFTDSFSVIGMIGAAPRISGSDGKSAFIIDVFANYTISRFYVGLGLGGWLTTGDNDFDDEDDDLDVILNMGARIFGEPDGFNTSLFVEARSAVDELDDLDLYGRFGAGLRFRF